MTTEVKTEKQIAEEQQEDDKMRPEEYSCQILLDKTSLEKANDKSFPTDAYLVWYNVDGNELLDVTRSSKRVNIFDMYYDKYGKYLKRIEYGFGAVNPTRWGYKPPEKKKRRKG